MVNHFYKRLTHKIKHLIITHLQIYFKTYMDFWSPAMGKCKNLQS